MALELARYSEDSPDDRTLTEARRPDLSNARLGLTAVERLAVEQLVSGAPGETADFVATRANALADDPEGACRRRTLAKALAVQDALGAQLTALLARAVAQRDDAAVRLLDRALTGCTNRVRLLAEELRAETLGGRKAVVQVGLAQNVTVLGGEG